jgi:apolipoprotein N-acyltransferase
LECVSHAGAFTVLILAKGKAWAKPGFTQSKREHGSRNPKGSGIDFMRFRLPLFLTLLSAGLYALSFPPFSLSFIAWIALVPFFLAVALVGPGVAALYGFLWCLVAAYGVGWWFPEMIANYLQVPLVIGWLGFFAVSIGLAGVYFAGFAAWGAWLTQRNCASPWFLAAGWSVCEFVRANLLIGNSWALLGYSQISHIQLMQIADATGPYGVGFLIAAVNAHFAQWLVPAGPQKRLLVSSLSLMVLLVGVLLYGDWRLSQTFTVGQPLPITVVQGAIEQKLRWQPAYRRANLDRYLALTRGAMATHPLLIFWPEYAVDFHLQLDSPLRESVFQISRDLDADLVLGGQYYNYGEADVEFYNSVFLVHRGRLAGRYDKTLLLPFAEANQVENLFPGIPNRYIPGQSIRVLRAPLARIGAFVCFEAMYPDLVKKFVLRGAELLANPSNDGWFGHATPAQHQLQIVSLRAIENRRYLVRATTTGISAVIDPYGRIVVSSEFGVPAVLTTTIARSHETTPYQRWGDLLCWVALICVLVTSGTLLARGAFPVRWNSPK